MIDIQILLLFYLSEIQQQFSLNNIRASRQRHRLEHLNTTFKPSSTISPKVRINNLVICMAKNIGKLHLNHLVPFHRKYVLTILVICMAKKFCVLFCSEYFIVCFTLTQFSLPHCYIFYTQTFRKYTSLKGKENNPLALDINIFCHLKFI